VLSQLGEHIAAGDAYQRALGMLGVSAAPTPAGLRSLVGHRVDDRVDG
jgi:hypothetical protein